MFVRWLYQIWRIFWWSVLSLALLIVLAGGGVWLALQQPSFKALIARRLEKAFNTHYKGTIYIGQLSGNLPFKVEVDNLRLDYPAVDSTSIQEPLAKCDRVTFSVDLWDLLTRRIRITSFNIDRPHFRFRSLGDSTYSILEALQRTKPVSNNSGTFIKDLNIYAPVLSIKGGTVTIDRLHHIPDDLHLPDPIRLDSVNTQFFLELNKTQRFLDINNFHAILPGMNAQSVSLSGQVFNDDRFLELNHFIVNAGRSKLQIDGEIDGFNIYKKNWGDQLRKSHYRVSVASSNIYPSEFSDLITDLPNLKHPVSFNFKVNGDLNDLRLNQMTLNVNGSVADFNGNLYNLDRPSRLGYDITMNNASLTPDILSGLVRDSTWKKFKDWGQISPEGEIKGNTDSLVMKVNVHFLSGGQIQMNGTVGLQSPYRYQGQLTVANIDLSRLSTFPNYSGEINMDANVNGMGWSAKTANLDFNSEIYNSRINNEPITRLDLGASLVEGVLTPRFTLVTNQGQITGNGRVRIKGIDSDISMKGSGRKVNISELLPKNTIPNTSLNFDYELNLNGLKPDSLYGRASFDVAPSLVGQDSVAPHQVYVDLNAPSNKIRTLRFTSNFMDLIMKGDMEPSSIGDLTAYWSDYFKKHINTEIKLNRADTTDTLYKSPALKPGENVNFSVDMHLKDLSLFKKYFPRVPIINSSGRLQATVKADNERLLVNGGWQDPHLSVDSLDLYNADVMLTASFNHQHSLKEFSNLDLETSVDSLWMPQTNMTGLKLKLSMIDDTVMTSGQIQKIGKNASFNYQVTTDIMDTEIVSRIRHFQLGNKEYTWTNRGVPAVIYTRSKKFSFRDFEFENGNQKLALQGVLSSDPHDSVVYSLQQINLQRISDLVNGDFNFEGTLNAKFSTRTLTKIPSIQGDIFINRLSLDNRPLGDFIFSSRYNSSKKRFETHIQIKADTSKYHTYYVNNDSVATNIDINGWVKPPIPGVKQDTTYYFNADFKQIDMWVMNYITPGIFKTIEGKADGQGYITGNYSSYDFHADFQTFHVHTVPVFLDTDLYLTGHVILDRHEGAIFDNMAVRDNYGGTGVFSGVVDLNNFERRKKLDLTMSMNNLRFLNNKYNPDVPFYGSVTGSGTVKLTGTNENPFIQTLSPINTTANSRLYIPQLSQTDVQNQGKFIQFVSHFSIGKKAKSQQPETTGKSGNSESVNNATENPDQKSFTELFQLDLQFNAPQNSTVQFIFDPVTGEVLNAKGGGLINITLEDQQLQMFGRLDITGGDYMFVAGGVFSRKFYIQNGGYIFWTGEPRNPEVNITAIYRARPNLQPLTGSTQPQRVPINLVLSLTGNINSLRNDYYFEYPNNTINIGQTPSVLSLLNSEDQKLLQAANLLLTGNFTSINTTAGTGSQGFGSSLQNNATQVGLSQLLSSQINTLLNSSTSDLDIDLNMNSFNQADLGIALRLFNDRLTLRREGIITGPYTYGANLGDLGAQYQINRSLSIQAFHRIDPALNNYVMPGANGFPYVNGVGLQYQLKFNSWQELPREFLRSLGIGRGKQKKSATPADTLKSSANKEENNSNRNRDK